VNTGADRDAEWVLSLSSVKSTPTVGYAACYDGPLTIVSADDSPPVDRPNLSKG